jgi:hypothetical protein
MIARSVVRWIVRPVAGGLMLFVGLSLLAPSVAGAVPPPPGARASVVAQVAPEEPGASAQAGEEGSTATDLTRRDLARELAAAGLSMSRDAILSESAGSGSPRQLVLAQMAADRFGIVKNPFFDPARVAVVRDGEAIADLATGVILGHRYGSAMFGRTEVIPTELLEALRARAGWNISDARRAEAARWARLLDGYVPVAFQTDEAYAAYVEAARANYLALAR